MNARTLLLLRHAEAEATRPGSRDRERRLTERGRAQAAAVGEAIKDAGWAVDHVLCSPAARAQETLARLGLPAAVEVETVESLFDAGSDTILELIRTLPVDVRCALVVGHAPGVPAVLHELVDPATVDQATWSLVETRFPAATLAALAVDDWSTLAGVRLLTARLHD